MGYLIPVTPQAFVNRISIFGPDETNIKEISYQLFLHLTIPINIFTPPKSLELYICPGIILATFNCSVPLRKDLVSRHIAAYSHLDSE